jgi:hypothetical protein
MLTLSASGASSPLAQLAGTVFIATINLILIYLQARQKPLWDIYQVKPQPLQRT